MINKLKRFFRKFYFGIKYTEQEVAELIDQLPYCTVGSLISEKVQWLEWRIYCDGRTDPHEDEPYQIARDEEILRRGEQAVGSLIELLKHSDWVVCVEAVRLLGFIQSAQAVPPLIALLTSKNSFDVKYTAVLALERIGTPEAVAAAKRWKRLYRIS
jgi:hypothetical protein